MKILALAFLLSIMFVSHVIAAEVWTPSTKISSITTYATAAVGEGDVTIEVSTPASGCSNGFWLENGAIGFNSSLSTVLSAYHAGTDVRLFGDTAARWSSSSGEYCKLTRIRFM